MSTYHDQLLDRIEKVTRERDEARAAVQRVLARAEEWDLASEGSAIYADIIRSDVKGKP